MDRTVKRKCHPALKFTALTQIFYSGKKVYIFVIQFYFTTIHFILIHNLLLFLAFTFIFLWLSRYYHESKSSSTSTATSDVIMQTHCQIIRISLSLQSDSITMALFLASVLTKPLSKQNTRKNK